jgi:hypothetical protein
VTACDKLDRYYSEADVWSTLWVSELFKEAGSTNYESLKAECRLEIGCKEGVGLSEFIAS